MAATLAAGIVTIRIPPMAMPPPFVWALLTVTEPPVMVKERQLATKMPPPAAACPLMTVPPVMTKLPLVRQTPPPFPVAVHW